MRKHTLVRDEKGPDGVFGTFEKWQTVEEEWLGNRQKVSCIPAGTYRCKRTWYKGGGYECFEVMMVPGRSRILFHVANSEEDIEGCIGIGARRGHLERKDEDTGKLVKKRAVLASKTAFAEFMEFFKDVDEWTLEIVEAWA